MTWKKLFYKKMYSLERYLQNGKVVLASEWIKAYTHPIPFGIIPLCLHCVLVW